MLVQHGTFIKLNEKKRPNSYLCSLAILPTWPASEDRTFICSKHKEDAGPTNNWHDPEDMKKTLRGIFAGCMRGRTMYVIPFSMGPIGSTHLAHRRGTVRFAVRRREHAHHDAHGQATCSTRWATASSCRACTPSARRSSRGRRTCRGRATRTRSTSCIFPKSARSGRTAAATAATRCWARSASPCASPRCMARDQGWMAEHMLILGVTNRRRAKRSTWPPRSPAPAARPTSRCSSRQRIPRLEGPNASATTLRGSNPASDGQLYAINPEAGFFGVAPGTSMQSNPNAMVALEKNTIFTNVALTHDGDVWWEGMTEERPRTADRLAAARMDARERAEGGASQRALHRAAVAVPRRSIRRAMTRRACRFRRIHFRRPPTRDHAACLRGAQLDVTASTSAPRCGSETTAAAAGQSRRSAPRSDGDAAVLRLSTWATTSATG